MNKSKTILLVEDDENDVFFMQAAVQQAGLTSPLQVVIDGRQAIDYLEGKEAYGERERYPLPAVILLDLKLPRVQGMEVLRWIRERRHFDMTSVIILSASHLEPDIALAYHLGANSFLTKPNNPRELTNMVELISRYWLQLNQPTSAMYGSSFTPVT